MLSLRLRHTFRWTTLSMPSRWAFFHFFGKHISNCIWSIRQTFSFKGLGNISIRVKSLLFVSMAISSHGHGTFPFSKSSIDWSPWLWSMEVSSLWAGISSIVSQMSTVFHSASMVDLTSTVFEASDHYPLARLLVFIFVARTIFGFTAPGAVGACAISTCRIRRSRPSSWIQHTIGCLMEMVTVAVIHRRSLPSRWNSFNHWSIFDTCDTSQIDSVSRHS